VRAFAHPAPCSIARDSALVRDLFPARPNVRDVSELRECLVNRLVVIPLIETEMLQELAGTWTHKWKAFESLLDQANVVRVGSSDRGPDRNPVPLRQKATLGLKLSAIRGIGPRFSPASSAFVIARSID